MLTSTDASDQSFLARLEEMAWEIIEFQECTRHSRRGRYSITRMHPVRTWWIPFFRRSLRAEPKVNVFEWIWESFSLKGCCSMLLGHGAPCMPFNPILIIIVIIQVACLLSLTHCQYFPRSVTSEDEQHYHHHHRRRVFSLWGKEKMCSLPRKVTKCLVSDAPDSLVNYVQVCTFPSHHGLCSQFAKGYGGKVPMNLEATDLFMKQELEVSSRWWDSWETLFALWQTWRHKLPSDPVCQYIFAVAYWSTSPNWPLGDQWSGQDHVQTVCWVASIQLSSAHTVPQCGLESHAFPSSSSPHSNHHWRIVNKHLPPTTTDIVGYHHHHYGSGVHVAEYPCESW